MAIDAAAAAAEIESALRVIGTPDRAESEKRYLKSNLAFLGTTVWQIRAAVNEARRGQLLDHDRLVELATVLWAKPVHERRMAAVMLLDVHPKLLSARRPTEVATWLAPRTDRASGVTMREAVRYLAPGDAERLMAAYREHRPAA